ncbi:septum formation initiator family protein [Candidatus Kaiserbacteria bacterium]|nr:septum formation initiator family protein [Candidatus Kaiserbacteria bacterium]MCB9811308.1 septum formation initiator family protein [Candidatus Nomurabacteria bacterium]
MSFLHAKQKKRSLILIRISVAILSLLAILLGFSVIERLRVEREMADRREAAEAELQRLTERQQSLEQQVEYLSNDQGVEAEIRKHFDVAREGEQVVVLVGDHTDDSVTDSMEVEEQNERSFWQRLFPWYNR